MADEETGQSESHGGGGEGNTFEAIGWALRAILKHWALILAAVLLTSGVSLAYSKSLPKIYEASTLIEFDPDVIKPLGNKTDPMVGWSALWDTKEYYETQYRIIQSDRVLSAVVRNLGLQNDPDFLGYKPTAPVPMESAVASLRGRLTVEPAKGSRLVYLKIQDTRPAQARRLSEAVAKAYIDHNLEKMVSATGDTVVWLSGQLDHFKHELEQTEDSLHEFKKQNDLPSTNIDDLSKMIRMEMQEYDGALTRTRLRRQELAARHNELSKVSTENPDQIPASELLSNAFLGQLRKQYQEAARERAELLAGGKGENHPEVKKADEKLALSRKALVNEIRTIQGAVARDLAIIQQQEAGEAALYEASRKKAVELNLKELEFHRLDRLRAQNEKLYAVLLEQLKEADLRRMMNTNNIRLIDTPVEPKAPIAPRVSTNVGIGFLAGLILGIALALLREMLDNTLKTPDDLEKRLDVTFLGLLPEMDDEDIDGKRAKRRKRARRIKTELAPELLVHERPASGTAEAARSLRTNLMFMNPDRPYRRLLVTSAAPAEGKTTVAVSIAISLAQGGQRVCIIDCDLRRPRLHRIFGRAGDVGLMNAIVGEATIEEVAKPTVVPNLSCIPCGPIPPNSADVVASERFKHLLDELGERFDRIVLDSPPVVAVTDSAILSTLVDGVILVVRAFKTTFGLARSGLRTLRDVDAPIAGAVLNAVNLDRHEYYYQRYYYYRREGYAPIPQSDLDRPSDEAPPPPPN
ncbi:MAG: polysaccharide biosynthesis tyrosine autokinase [Labilithrix sp.]|nr:polysaccharide biosynthesis tyrosine autokinase [Labilithrix sp.]MCW5835598.1 polysaccharide biosynthesis tyrosine autokinase [Labilithrix sp.]